MTEKMNGLIREPRSARVLCNLSLVLSAVEEAKADGVKMTGSFACWEDRLTKLCHTHSPTGYLAAGSNGSVLTKFGPRQLHKSCVNWWHTRAAQWQQPQFLHSKPLIFWTNGRDALLPEFLEFIDNVALRLNSARESTSISATQVSVDLSETQASSEDHVSLRAATRSQSRPPPQEMPAVQSIRAATEVPRNVRHSSLFGEPYARQDHRHAIARLLDSLFQDVRDAANQVLVDAGIPRHVACMGISLVGLVSTWELAELYALCWGEKWRETGSKISENQSREGSPLNVIAALIASFVLHKVLRLDLLSAHAHTQGQLYHADGTDANLHLHYDALAKQLARSIEPHLAHIVWFRDAVSPGSSHGSHAPTMNWHRSFISSMCSILHKAAQLAQQLSAQDVTYEFFWPLPGEVWDSTSMSVAWKRTETAIAPQITLTRWPGLREVGHRRGPKVCYKAQVALPL